MSSFIDKAKNPKTGKMQKACFLDDYYGNHKYGIGFKKDGTDFDWDKDEIKDLDFYKESELKK